MKVPLNWLNELVKLPEDTHGLTDRLTMVGHMLDKIEIKDGQTIVDLELRGNRADCYSILGIAREVSAIYGSKLKNIQTTKVKLINKQDSIKLEVQTPLVKRVGMIEINNIKIEKSPKWLSEKLLAYGMESKNNIVDLTNYVMLETGEPMHAFDMDKIGNNLQIRLAKTGEKITTFQDSTLTLTKDDLVWAKDDKVLSVAGAVGEKYHSVSDTTKNILLEAANYERSNIRRTVYRHNLLTDAGIRHEKELDPNMVDFAISRFLYFVEKYKWGEFKPVVYDYYPKKVSKWKINLDINYLKSLSGIDIDLAEVKRILKNLQIEITKNNKGSISVLIPTHRTDVVLEEDLIEEIIRIYGYDKIPTKTLSLEIPKNITPNYIVQENKLRQSAVSIGFDENISLSFVKEKYKDKNISLLNPPSPDTKYLRNTLFFNLLDSAQKIINDRGNIVQLFEIGKIYKKEKGGYKEERKIAFIYWKKENYSFSEFKSLITAFFEKAGINKPEYIAEMIDLKFTNSYILKLNNKEIGWGGEHEGGLLFSEINLEEILNLDQRYKVSLWSKFPPQIEDLTLIIPEKTYIGEVLNAIQKADQLITEVALSDIYDNAYTFNIEYHHPEKTLTDKEVKEVRGKLLKALKTKFGINLSS